MMKKLLGLLFVFTLLFPSAGFALGVEHKQLGVGLNLGEPFGVNARYFLFDQLAGDATFGYGLGEESIVLQFSGLFHFKRILDYDAVGYSIVPYAGGGFKTGVDIAGRNDGEGIFALRLPIGGSMVMKEGLFEISMEFSPGIEFTPETAFDPTGGIGLRYYFW